MMKVLPSSAGIALFGSYIGFLILTMRVTTSVPLSRNAPGSSLIACAYTLSRKSLNSTDFLSVRKNVLSHMMATRIPPASSRS